MLASKESKDTKMHDDEALNSEDEQERIEEEKEKFSIAVTFAEGVPHGFKTILVTPIG